MKMSINETSKILSLEVLKKTSEIAKLAISEKLDYKSFEKESQMVFENGLPRPILNYFKYVFDIETGKQLFEETHHLEFDKLTEFALQYNESLKIKNSNSKKLKSGFFRKLWDTVVDFVNNTITAVNNILQTFENALNDIFDLNINFGILNQSIRRHSIVENENGIFAITRQNKIARCFWNTNNWSQIDYNYNSNAPKPHSFANCSSQEPNNVFYIDQLGGFCSAWKNGSNYEHVKVAATQDMKIIPGTLRLSTQTGTFFALCLNDVDRRYDIAYIRWFNNDWYAGKINTHGAVIVPDTFELSKDQKKIYAINKDGKLCTIWVDINAPSLFDGMKYSYAVIEPQTHDLEI